MEVSKDTTVWGQRNTLRPIDPCPGPSFAAIVDGIHIGDPKFDKLTESDLKKVVCGQGKCPLPPNPDPKWADYDIIARGQKVFQEFETIIVLCLSSLLINGFVVGRFTDVLELSGYSSSPMETHRRFEMTLIHILRWMHYDLQDPNSIGRHSITYVRCLHTLARKRAAETWAKELAKGDTGIGVPLSQYDMTLVLLAFGPLSLLGCEKILGYSLKREDKANFIQTWRLIGYHLGIEDEYNICSSLERSESIQNEAFAVSSRYSESLRKSSYLLLNCTMEGFGRYSGLGSCYWDSVTLLATDPRARSLHHMIPSIGSHMKYTSFSAQLFCSFILFSLRWKPWRDLTNRRLKNYSPRSVKFAKRVAILAKFHDFIYWLSDRMFFPLTPLWLYFFALSLFRFYFVPKKSLRNLQLTPLVVIFLYHFGLALAL